jgi:hypothetical protein
LPPTSSRNRTFVIPENSIMQSASVAVNSGVGQIASTASYNHFVPLNPRAPQKQAQSMSGPCQGAIPTDSRQKTNRPETVPMTSNPDVIITDQTTLPKVPPTSSFIPELQRNFSQAPRDGAILADGEPRRAEPNFVPMERATRSQVPPTSRFFPLPFRHPGLSFPTLLHPAIHPQNGPKLWSVRRSVGHREVT